MLMADNEGNMLSRARACNASATRSGLRYPAMRSDPSPVCPTKCAYRFSIPARNAEVERPLRVLRRAFTEGNRAQAAVCSTMESTRSV